MLNFEKLGVQPINKGLNNCNGVTNQRPSWWYNRGNLSMFTVCDYSRFAWPQIFHMGHVTSRNPNGPDLIIPTRTHYKILKFHNTDHVTLLGVCETLCISPVRIVGCLELDCLFINYNIIIRVKFWQVVIII